MSDSILLTRDGFIATVTLNRPDRLNALDLASWNSLAQTFDGLSRDDSLRCVVIKGAGNNFAAGADIQAFAQERADAASARRYAQAVQRALKAVGEGKHPVVACISGVCVGGGLELASVCDIRICGASSRFGVPVNKLGSTMAYGELAALVQLVGPAAAREILLEGAVFGAERALALGLVNRAVADGDVERESYAAARRICDGAPLAARRHREFIRRLADPKPLTQAEIDASYADMDTEDYREGVAAFLAKRPPVFKGR